MALEHVCVCACVDAVAGAKRLPLASPTASVTSSWTGKAGGAESYRTSSTSLNGV